MSPLAVSADGHFLQEQEGRPFFWLGENAWELFQRLRHEEVDAYLQDRAAKQFNILLAVIGGVHPEPNVYGELPFIDRNPSRPNPKYFQNVDWIVDRALAHGIRSAIVPAWQPHTAYPAEKLGPKDFTLARSQVYGRWLGHRYRQKGVVWILGGDSTPLWPDTHGLIIDYRPIYDALAAGINEGVGGRAVITYHPWCCSFPETAHPRTSLYFGSRTWLTINMLQTSHYAHPVASVVPELKNGFSWLGPFNYEPVALEYSASPTRPIIDGEALFEDLGIDNDSQHVAEKGYWTGYDSLNAAYHSVFAGAAGHTYGNHSVWQFYDPAHNKPDPPARLDLPWQSALKRPVSSQFQFLKSLMLSRPYTSRIPDDSLVIGDLHQGASHIAATRDREGRYAMVFVPKGQRVSVDLRKIRGTPAVAWWYDPRSGEATRVADNLPTAGIKEFTPPSTDTTLDWVLVLDAVRAKFQPPGARQFLRPQ